ncbi:hypothetical protein WA158_000452 [Blastocystis sp. Blastoise]
MPSQRQYLSFYDAALNILKRRPHSEFEINQKLHSLIYKRKARRYGKKYTDDTNTYNSSWTTGSSMFSTLKKTEDEEIIDTIEQLKNEGLIDDIAFTQWYIENRQSFSPRSNMKITQELLQKGVSNDIIKENMVLLHEEENCESVIQQKKQRYTDPQKMKVYLLRNVYIYIY